MTWPPTDNPWVLLAAVVTGTIAVARAARLITSDAFPPAEWARARWITLTHGGTWGDLATCPFCCAPYLAAGDLAWALLSDLHWTWWIVNLWAAVSYLAAILVVRDEPPEC